jgi:hypothetical protein
VSAWPRGWREPESSEKAALERELARELSAGHALYRQGASLIARSDFSDDVLFALPDGRVAAVHLTWRIERKPEWPSTQVFASIEAWRPFAESP